MAPSLLPTKLYFPPPRPGLVARPRLLRKLDEARLPGKKLVLISAPAGFGKTTLASEWARQTGLAVAWLGLEEADNDPTRLWHYLVAALQTIDGTLGQAAAAALQAPNPPPPETLVTLLVQDLLQFARPFLLVLDDYHLIEADVIHAGLDFFIDHLPPGVRLVLLTRADPPLHLARRRGRGELCEARAVDLRFTSQEIAAFLSETMHLDLPAYDVAALESRTEGWIAGLQMAALALQALVGGQDQPGEAELGSAHGFVTAFTGDDRYVADYLVEEVLLRQPEGVRSFLLQTSILNRMCAGLCDALLAGVESERDTKSGRDTARGPATASEWDADAGPAGGLPAPFAGGAFRNSQAMLEHLERANLFSVPLDNRRQWFRYHHLFAHLLRQHLAQQVPPQAVQALYRRASEWHAANGFFAEAVEYALTGGDPAAAAELMEQAIRPLFERGELTTLARWAEILPEAVLAAHPRLCAGLAWATNATNRHALCARLVAQVEAGCGLRVDEFLGLDEEQRAGLAPDKLGALVELAVLRARLTLDQGQFGEMIAKYSLVLPYLSAARDKQPYLYNPPSTLRPPMVFMFALAHELQGHIQEAAAGFEQAVAEAQALGNTYIIALALGHLGSLQMLAGDLQAAEETFGRALGAEQEAGDKAAAYFAIMHSGLGLLAYERGDLALAGQELGLGIARGRLWSVLEALLPGYQGLAQLRLAQGDRDGALQALDELTQLERQNPPVVQPAVAFGRALVGLRLGQIEKAELWRRQMGYRLDGENPGMPGEHALLLGRLLVQTGRAAAARSLLERQAAAASAGGQWGVWIRLSVLLALALAAQGERTAARAQLAAAVGRAGPQGYQRSFVDEGEPVRLLLLDLSAQLAQPEDTAAYCTRLLAAFEPAAVSLAAEPALAVAGPLATAGGGLVEPLSAREMEILSLIVGGASNAEIASRAYISLNTVKKHIGNIYAKLEVSTRVQAVERARQLGLIE